MNETLVLVLSGLAGLLLGAFFFGGLWWTVNKGIASSQPALWFLGSFLVRMGFTLAGFYFVSGGRWERLLVCFLGFITARILVSWLTRSPKGAPIHSTVEASHASESR